MQQPAVHPEEVLPVQQRREAQLHYRAGLTQWLHYLAKPVARLTQLQYHEWGKESQYPLFRWRRRRSSGLQPMQQSMASIQPELLPLRTLSREFPRKLIHSQVSLYMLCSQGAT